MGSALVMEYVIVALIVLALVGGAVTFFVINAAKKGGPAAPSDSGAGGDRSPRVGDPGPEAQRPESERLANRSR
jgi:hypothetical protein